MTSIEKLAKRLFLVYAKNKYQGPFERGISAEDVIMWEWREKKEIWIEIAKEAKGHED